MFVVLLSDSSQIWAVTWSEISVQGDITEYLVHFLYHWGGFSSNHVASPGAGSTVPLIFPFPFRPRRKWSQEDKEPPSEAFSPRDRDGSLHSLTGTDEFIP